MALPRIYYKHGRPKVATTADEETALIAAGYKPGEELDTNTDEPSSGPLPGGGGGGGSTNASDLTSGTLNPARLGDSSIPEGKLEPAARAKLAQGQQALDLAATKADIPVMQFLLSGKADLDPNSNKIPLIQLPPQAVADHIYRVGEPMPDPLPVGALRLTVPAGAQAPTKPSQVTGLNLTPSSGQVTLVWTTPANGGAAITDYKVQYKLTSAAATAFQPFAHVASNATTMTVTGLTNNSSYDFKVSAINAYGEGPESVVSTATPVPAAAAPSQVTGANATGGDGKITLVWSAPAANGAPITDYVIQRRVAGGTFGTITDGVSTATTYVDNTVTNGTAYEYQIAAVNSVNTGPFSTPVGATPTAVVTADTTAPTVPTNLQAVAGINSVALSWTGSSDAVGVTGYRIRRDGATTPLATVTTTTYNDTGLVAGQTYSYTVTAFDAANNESTPSTGASATPTASPRAALVSAASAWHEVSASTYTPDTGAGVTWVDESSGARDLHRAAGSPQLIYNAADTVMNGKPSLQKNAFNQWLEPAAAGGAPAASNYMLAFALTSTSGASIPLLLSAGSDRWAIANGNNRFGSVTHAGGAAQSGSIATGVTAGTPLVLVLVYTTATKKLEAYVNGVLKDTLTMPANSNGTAFQLFTAANSDTAGTWVGRITNFAAFKSNDAQLRADVTAYLKGRLGIA